jgi:hypothetical protein
MFKTSSRLFKRRPSASMVVATLALFVALSGGAYAAVAIPGNSVGFAQLRVGAVGTRDLANNAVGTKALANNAVSYTKIAPGEIGHARVAQSQIQWRVTGACTGANAVQSVTATGGVTCTTTLPTDYTTAGLSEPLSSSSSPTVLATDAVPAGQAAQVTSTPYVQVDGSAGAQQVTVSCEIAAGTATQTRDITLNLTAAHESAAGSIPLSVTPAAGTSAQAVAVSCVRGYDQGAATTGSAPTVQASAGANVLQIASAATVTTAGTSTTAYSTPSVTTASSLTTPATTTTGTASTPTS